MGKQLLPIKIFAGLLIALFAFVLPSLANDETKKSKVSVTTGWHKISGWEESIIKKDENLRHWNWIPMQEMSKGYQKLAPGALREKGVMPRAPQYIKPKRIPPMAPHSQPNKNVVSAPSVPRYIKPVHVPMAETMTKANQHAPETNAAVVSPATRAGLVGTGTQARLASPGRDIRIGVPSTSMRMAVPGTSAQLAAPSTGIRLAVPTTNVRLTAPRTSAALSLPAKPLAKNSSANATAKDQSSGEPIKGRTQQKEDAMSACARSGSEADLFQDPQQEPHAKYGTPHTPVTTYGGNASLANVRAKVIKSRSR